MNPHLSTKFEHYSQMFDEIARNFTANIQLVILVSYSYFIILIDYNFVTVTVTVVADGVDKIWIGPHRIMDHGSDHGSWIGVKKFT